MINPENEKLYNVRAALPDHPQIFRRWADESAHVRMQLQNVSHLDLAYGPAPRQRLDLFCTPHKKSPLLVFLHGGYWQAMDKNFFSFLAPAFLQASVSLAVVNYSLCPDVSLDEIAHEIKNALLWLPQHGDQYGYMADKLHLSGHSAGGQLVAMMMTDRETAPLMASALSLSGIFDLTPLVDTSINEKLGLDESSARRNSPVFKPPQADIPVLLCVGELESKGFHWQSDLLADTWADQVADIKRLIPGGCKHLTVLDQLSDPDSALFQATLSMAKL